MWILIILIVLAVAVGLAWSYYNLVEIKQVSTMSNSAMEDEMESINLHESSGVVAIGHII